MPLMGAIGDVKQMINKNPEVTNVYAHSSKYNELLRAVSIQDHWRITEYAPENNTWLFLDDIHYETAAQAMRNYI
jgi:hypothetical protein